MIRQVKLFFLMLTALWLPGASCVTVTDVTADDSGSSGVADRVTIRVVNGCSDLAVDIQLYATGNGVSDPDTELFIGANQLAAGLGFAGSGLLESGGSDSVALSCEDALVVGTLGGRFIDEDTGSQVGSGTRYVYFQGNQFQCGSTITFTYMPSGRSFVTNVQITPPGG